jgi:hypothetical protein
MYNIWHSSHVTVFPSIFVALVMTILILVAAAIKMVAMIFLLLWMSILIDFGVGLFGEAKV